MVAPKWWWSEGENFLWQVEPVLGMQLKIFLMLLGPFNVIIALQMLVANESGKTGIARRLGMFCLMASGWSLLVAARVLLK